MRLLLMFSLLTFATGSISAQVTTNDSMIIIRMVPEGSFVDSVEVNFAGVWSPGFERNKFIPCKNWMPDSLGGAPFISNRIGFSDGEEAWKFAFKMHPDTVVFVTSKPTDTAFDLYIEGSGWLIGPSTFDHLGMNRYTIKASSFKKIRWANLNECLE